MNLVKLRQLRDQAQEKLNEAQSNFDAFNTVVHTPHEPHGMSTLSLLDVFSPPPQKHRQSKPL